MDFVRVLHTKWTVGTGPHTTVANIGQQKRTAARLLFLPKRDLVDSTRSDITHEECGDPVLRRGKLGRYKNTLCEHYAECVSDLSYSLKIKRPRHPNDYATPTNVTRSVREKSHTSSNPNALFDLQRRERQPAFLLFFRIMFIINWFWDVLAQLGEIPSLPVFPFTLNPGRALA